MRLYSVHVSPLLSAYLDGELSEKERSRVAAHLETCARCREEYEAIRSAAQALSSLPYTSAPASLWSRIEAELQATSPPAPLRNEEGRKSAGEYDRSGNIGRDWSIQELLALARKRPLAAAGAIVLCLTSISIGTMLERRWYRSNHPVPLISVGPSWTVARLSGLPKIGSQGVKQTGRLGVGQWLKTDGNSQAEITVADIGKVTVEPNSSVRLEETGKEAHRLQLAQGELSAFVKAPPRLFMVDTQAARAVDLGCAYTLRVDKAGITYLFVTSGRVVLEGKGREAMVPAGATCETHPDTGPGTPCFTDAPESMKAALLKLDFENGGEKEIRTVLGSARPIDTLPLWHLLSRVPAQERGKVYDRLAQIAPPPSGVTRGGILRLDKKMLELWKAQIEPNWGMALSDGIQSLLYSDPTKP